MPALLPGLTGKELSNGHQPGLVAGRVLLVGRQFAGRVLTLRLEATLIHGDGLTG